MRKMTNNTNMIKLKSGNFIISMCLGHRSRSGSKRSSSLSTGQPPDFVFHQCNWNDPNRGAPGQGGNDGSSHTERILSGCCMASVCMCLSKVKGHYFLIVEASDGATHPRRSRLMLSVTVLDVDDNSPIFTQQSYSVSLAENSPKHTAILQLRVSAPLYTYTHTLQLCPPGKDAKFNLT